jgi:hypothetical protein
LDNRSRQKVLTRIDMVRRMLQAAACRQHQQWRGEVRGAACWAGTVVGLANAQGQAWSCCTICAAATVFLGTGASVAHAAACLSRDGSSFVSPCCILL